MWKTGEGRVKMPLSPVASAQNRAFSPDIQLAESSSLSNVAHSFSSSSLTQSQFDSNSNTSGFYSGPHRGQMRLQSRRSQSREDLNCSVADAHLVKVWGTTTTTISCLTFFSISENQNKYESTHGQITHVQLCFVNTLTDWHVDYDAWFDFDQVVMRFILVWDGLCLWGEGRGGLMKDKKILVNMFWPNGGIRFFFFV